MDQIARDSGPLTFDARSRSLKCRRRSGLMPGATEPHHVPVW